MAIFSSSFTLQKLSISPNDRVFPNQFATDNVNFQFWVLGSSKNPNFLKISIRNEFNFKKKIGGSGQVFELKCNESEIIAKRDDVSEVLEESRIDNGSGADGGDGRLPSGGGGGGSGGEDGDFDEEEFGPIMMFEEVMGEAEKRGATLPSDIIEAAKTTGIRSLILSRYLDLQVEMLSV